MLAISAAVAILALAAGPEPASVPQDAGRIVKAESKPFTESWSDMQARTRLLPPPLEWAEQAHDRPEYPPLPGQIRKGPGIPGSPVGAAGMATRNPQGIGAGFPGTSLSQQFTAFTTGSIPPDTMGAIGPLNFLEVLNRSVGIYTRAGVQSPLINLNTFFTVVVGPTTYPRNGAFDPRVVYDTRSGRFFATALERGDPNRTNNNVILAVSRTSDAAGVWDKYVIPIGEPTDTVNNITFFSDFDQLGVDRNGVYIAVTIFRSVGGVFQKLAATPLAPLLAASPSLGAVTVFNDFADMYSTPIVAHNQDAIGANAPAWVIASAPLFEDVALRKITWVAGVPTVDAFSTNIDTPAFGNSPPNCDAQGSTIQIETSDLRMQNAVIRNGRLWACRGVGVDSAGSNAGFDRCACEWFEFNTAGGTATLVQRGLVFDPAAAGFRHYFYPSISVSGQGHAAMGFSGCTPTEFVGAYVTGRLAGDTTGTMQAISLLKAGEAAYTRDGGTGRNRWGDYSYTSVDPADDQTIWTIQEYADSDTVVSNWQTWISPLIAPPPATPTSISPSSLAQGFSGSVTITGSTASGAGFFDNLTGAGARFAASVSGADVTLSNFNVTAPGTFTATATVSGTAATGLRMITATNPDGQPRTSGNILTITTPPPPANNQCSAATAIAVGVAQNGTTTFATADGTAPCGPSSPDVWYVFTSSTSRWYDVVCTAATFDSVVSAQTGCPGAVVTQVACGADTGPGTASSFRAVLAGANTFRIRVGGQTGQSGPFSLLITFVPSPGNDDCTGATLVTGTGTFPLSNIMATQSIPASVDCPAASSFNSDVWYRWVSPGDGTMSTAIATSVPAAAATRIAVYDGGAVPVCPSPTGQPVACNAAGGAAAATVVNGRSYYIRIGNALTGASNQGTGTFTISFTAASGACCDGAGQCAIRTPASCAGNTYQGDGTTCVPNPCPQPGVCCRGSTCQASVLPAACTGANTAFVSAAACNAPGNNTVPCCKADFNHTNGVSVQDIFDFLGAHFAGDPLADFNGSGLSVQDIFDFLAAYFSGCP